MQPDDTGHLRIARIRSPDVRPGRRLVPGRVVRVHEVVVAVRIGTQLRVVTRGAQRQGRAAAPPPHHLGRQQLLFVGAARVLLQVLAERRHALVQLAEHHVGTVATQDLRSRHRRHGAGLVQVAEHELAGLERLLLGVAAGDAASFDGRMPDPVPEPEGFSFCGQRVTVLAPDRLDTREVRERRAGAPDRGFEPLLVR